MKITFTLLLLVPELLAIGIYPKKKLEKRVWNAIIGAMRQSSDKIANSVGKRLSPKANQVPDETAIKSMDLNVHDDTNDISSIWQVHSAPEEVPRVLSNRNSGDEISELSDDARLGMDGDDLNVVWVPRNFKISGASSHDSGDDLSTRAFTREKPGVVWVPRNYKISGASSHDARDDFSTRSFTREKPGVVWVPRNDLQRHPSSKVMNLARRHREKKGNPRAIRSALNPEKESIGRTDQTSGYLETLKKPVKKAKF